MQVSITNTIRAPAHVTSTPNEDSPLGWVLRPSLSSSTPTPIAARTATNGWFIPPTQLPRLSHPEAQVVAKIRDAYFQDPQSNVPTINELHRVIQSYCSEHHIQLDPAQIRDMEVTLTLATREAGPLTPLLNEPQIEEIALTGIGRAHPVRVFHVQHGWMDTPLFFTHEKEVITLLNRLTRESGKRLSGATPIVNAPLPGGSRLHAAIAPVCGNGVEASIRKFVARATQPNDLLRMNVLPAPALSLLTAALKSDSSILIVGNTGSGKTTTLNALLGALPENERIILAEETPELHLTHAHVVHLRPAPEAELPLARIIRETLRMRPDRVVIGEIRFPEEAYAFMECVLAGQGKGTYATFHGHSAAEALARLRQFGLRDADLGWISLLVVQKRWTIHAPNQPPREMRAITEIVELESHEGALSLRPLFAWNDETQKLAPQDTSVRIRREWTRSFPNQKWGQ